ncbi:MAG: hypothetical protein KAI79_00930 [Bacteroidales bacterium]|nr:hypothetical protein [Bacteroidales bacterium]
MFTFVKYFVWTLLYSVFLFLFYSQAYRPQNKYPSDLPAHINFINHLNDIAHPLWHYCVIFISDILHISLQHAAIAFTSLLVLSIFIIINKILEFTLKNELQTITSSTKQYILLILSFALLTASAIYFPFFSTYIYLGQSACGIWHNVTLLMVKPFAFLSMFFSVLYIQTKNTKFFILGLLLTVLSIFSKPNFILMFLPALYIFILYYLYQEKNIPFKEFFKINTIFNQNKHIFIYLFIITLVSFSILISQFLAIFGGNNPIESKIIVDFLGVWSVYTPNVGVSLFLIILFPLLTLIFIRHTKSDFYVLSLIMFIISVIIYSVFAESGHRYHDGNFSWSMHIAYHIFFLFSTVEFLKGYNHLSTWKKYLLSITFSLHIISGLFYFGRILSGFHYV